MPGCHSTERGGRNAVLAAHAGAALPGGGLDANACLDSVGADDPAARLSGAESIERHRWLRTVTVIAYHSPAICTVRSRVRRAEVVAPYDNYRHRRPIVHIFGHHPLIRHGPSGRATSCPRCGIRFPGPLGHGNRAAAWLCPRFIRRTPRALAPQAARVLAVCRWRRRRFGHSPPGGRRAAEGVGPYGFPSRLPLSS